MCGIGGYIALQDEIVSRNSLDIIEKTLLERGPDAGGQFLKDRVGLVHRRLSIIDLSEKANQPFETEKSVIVLNGEIYNFKVLKKELDELNVQFISTSDTEVLIKYFDVFGIEKTLRAIEGMFVFCIYDKVDQKIILARDVVGKKPLYYYFKDNKFIFSSDIRGLKDLELPLTLNKFAFNYFLYEGASPQPHSIYNEIKQVKPGCYLELNLSKKELKENYFFQFTVSEPKTAALELKDVVKTTEQLLKDAIQKRLIADRPLGAFLSGGLDSSIIVSLMSQMTSNPVKTFTIGFKGDKENELQLASLVAKKYKTDHHEMLVDFNVAGIVEELLDYFGEPFADASLLPTYIISKQIKDHVTVVLSGDGGDEIFCGYNSFVIADRAQKILSENKSAIGRKFALTKKRIADRLLKKENSAGAVEAFIDAPIEEKLFRYMGFMPEEQKKFNKLYEQSFIPDLRNYLNENWKEDVSLVNSLSYAYIKGRLLNSYLVKVDRMSMKNSLEVRCPMLDKELIQFLLKQSADTKMGGNSIRKYLLYEIGKKYLPTELLTAKKRGFGVPMDHLMRNDLKQMFGDIVLGSSKIRSYLDVGYIEKKFNLHQEHKSDFGQQLWNILVLCNWLNKNNEK